MPIDSGIHLDQLMLCLTRLETSIVGRLHQLIQAEGQAAGREGLIDIVVGVI